jgi:glutathione S-transferase
MAFPDAGISFHPMDDETRAAFARMERWFELGQAQHLELRAEVRQTREELKADIGGVRAGVARVEARLTALEREFRAFRDWATAAISDLRTSVTDIIARLERLERRQGDPV